MFTSANIQCCCFVCVCLGYCCYGLLIRVTEVRCRSVDESVIKVSKCYVEQLPKHISRYTVNLTLVQEVTSVMVKLQFRKKSNNRYNPYFHSDVTFDGCKFMENQAVSPLGNYIFAAMRNCSNFNHTCPYKNYIAVNSCQIDMKYFKLVPLPTGEYSLNSQWYNNGKQVFLFSLFFSLNE